MQSRVSKTDIEEKCRDIRRDIFLMIQQAQCGHLGGSLSSVEIMATLYFKIMRIDPARPGWDDRDRFINSKGHATAAYYATLAHRGYFQRDELIKNFINVRSCYEEHGCVDVSGVDISTGSLGQGLSVGAGVALSAKMLKKSFRVYVLIGDGECQEGQIWEAAMFASHNRLHNLSVIVDQNRLQVSGKTAEVLSIEPLAEKWTAFGWNVLSVDGHDVGALTSACLQAEQEKNPTVLIARTIKGKGVSFMENNPDWHSFQALDEQHVKIVQRELGIS